MKTHRFLFVGLGSIGLRHLRNLHHVAEWMGMPIEVEALRHSSGVLSDELQTLLCKTFTDIAELGEYDAIFICNPTQLHIETLLRLKDASSCFFIEKPLDVAPLTSDQRKCLEGKRIYVACPLRHTRLFEELKGFTRANTIVSARVICSSYLPEWRAGSDYRTLYCANPQSGGVKLDLIHDFDYVIELFGMPERRLLVEAKVSSLEIASSDITVAVFIYHDKLVELHLDYFGRVPQRSIELFTQEDVTTFDFIKNEVRRAKAGICTAFAEDANDKYLAEIKRFLGVMLDEEANVNDVDKANSLLKLVLQGDI